MLADLSWLRSWLDNLILPSVPPPAPDPASERATDAALADAAAAAHELEQLKRRARAVGIDVEIRRGWGPREADGHG